MWTWLKKQLTLQTVLMLVLLFGSFSQRTGSRVIGLFDVTDKNSQAISELVKVTRSLAERVEALERRNLSLNDVVAKEFPRRSELEPRLRAIEDGIKEQNMLLRRQQEQYRR